MRPTIPGWPQHPDWFTTLPDGSIAFAENPPKKYQDIYPLNFDNDPAGLYAELLRVVRLWIARGVSIFRVDNPHTKPIDFWEWLIAQVRRTDPEVIFLAEAFTAPPMLHELARIGFSQSYTYFIWRTGKAEITEYIKRTHRPLRRTCGRTSLSTPRTSCTLHCNSVGRRCLPSGPFWRPHCRRPGACIPVSSSTRTRPSNPAARNTSIPRNTSCGRAISTAALAQGRSLQPTVSKLNAISRAHPALQSLAGLTFHSISNEQLLCYSRRDAATGDTVIVVVCLDPRSQQWGQTDLSMADLGLEPDDVVEVVDELSGDHYQWGRYNAVGLDPHWRPAHILRVDEPAGSTD